MLRKRLITILGLFVFLLTSVAAFPNQDLQKQPASASFERGTISKRPIAVMLDNHPNAYPQTGMQKATLVYEALAEFGITRFMAVYVPGATDDVPVLGPVRSARLYYVQWAMGYKALYAHAGGSPQALETLDKTRAVINLDALLKNGKPYFYRSTKRKAPHNLYTNASELSRAANDFKVADLKDANIGYLFKSANPGQGGEPISKINYFFIYANDPVGWVYDAASNSYLRTRRGKAAIDAASGGQLRTQNVVVIEVKERKVANDPKGRIEQDVIGSGPGTAFIDGVSIPITWKKETATSQLAFFTESGSELRFNPGQIWISVIPAMKNLTTKP